MYHLNYRNHIIMRREKKKKIIIQHMLVLVWVPSHGLSYFHTKGEKTKLSCHC